jgi:hypothetical protein
MFYGYGIFDDEVDPIIDMVRSHAPLEEIRAGQCPTCGAPIAVEFSELGDGFQIYCKGKPLHLSKWQEITDPPTWWPECVTSARDCTYHWREWHSFDEAGILTMKVSGYRADGCHWSGQLECSPDHVDYEFWCWVLLESGCSSDLINDEELVDLRERFARIAAS